MEIIIRGDKIQVTDSMKDYIKEKIEKLEKFLDNSESVRANIVVKIRNVNQIVEITIPLKSCILRTEEVQTDFYKAVDKATDKLERQIRKNKTKILKHNKVKKDFDIEEIESEETEIPIAKRKKIPVKPMSEEEAVLQMELLDHDFYMYIDSETNKPSVVYKRKNDDYGIIMSE